MGEARPVKTYPSPAPVTRSPLPAGITRRRPGSYAEWKVLRRWGLLPAWEEAPIGYLLREIREDAGLTQRELAAELGCTQQAVAYAERWSSNPTTAFLRRWSVACGKVLDIRFNGPERNPGRRTRPRGDSRGPAASR